MIIGIDGRYAQDDLVGVGNYIKNLVIGLTSKGFDCVIFYSSKPKYKIGKSTCVVLPSTNRYIFEQILLPISLIKNKIDIYHCTGNLGLPIFTFMPTILTIHDLIPLSYPNYFQYSRQPFLSKNIFKLNTKLSCLKAKRIIVDSKFVKKDVLSFFNIPRSKIEIIYLGVSLNSGGILPNKLNKNSYILNQGGINVRKNLETLIKSFSLVIKKFPKYKLVITGENLILKAKLRDLARELDIEKSVIFVGYVPTKTLGAIIRNASCICYPSITEGFGMPVLEGFKAGVPVVCSNNTSLSEVANDAAILVNPNNFREIASKIVSILRNKSISNKMIKKGKLVVEKFTWERAVNRTIDIYREVLR